MLSWVGMLKSCPFCGGDAGIAMFSCNNIAFGYCKECNTQIEPKDFTEEWGTPWSMNLNSQEVLDMPGVKLAIEIWNRRV